MKKAVIFDLDETLEHGSVFHADDKTMYIMTLRPGLDRLADFLEEYKKISDTKIILCTDSVTSWNEVFYKKCPRFKNIFDIKYNRDNRSKWDIYDMDKYSVESYLDYRHGSQKPATTFGFDKFLFIDDNTLLGRRLEKLAEAKLNNTQDMNYFSGFDYFINLEQHIRFKEASKVNAKIAKMYLDYINYELQNPGIDYMIDAIKTFEKDPKKIGYKNFDPTYQEAYKKYHETLWKKKQKLDEEIHKLEKKEHKSYYPTKDYMYEYFKDNCDLSHEPNALINQHSDEEEIDEDIDK